MTVEDKAVIPTALQKQAERLLQMLIARGEKIATAESCTGGLLAATLTEVVGCSEAFDMGLVSYSNGIKQHYLDVSEEILTSVGAVSPEVAEAMAKGICQAAAAQLGVGITGIAGPGGGSAMKPVGLVYIGVCYHGRITVKRCCFAGERGKVRLQAVTEALAMMEQALIME